MTTEPGGPQAPPPLASWRNSRGLLLGLFALKTIVLFALLYLTLDLAPGADLRLYKALVTPLYFFEFTLVGAILTIVAFSKAPVRVEKRARR